MVSRLTGSPPLLSFMFTTTGIEFSEEEELMSRSVYNVPLMVFISRSAFRLSAMARSMKPLIDFGVDLCGNPINHDIPVNRLN